MYACPPKRPFFFRLRRFLIHPLVHIRIGTSMACVDATCTRFTLECTKRAKKNGSFEVCIILEVRQNSPGPFLQRSRTWNLERKYLKQKSSFLLSIYADPFGS